MTQEEIKAEIAGLEKDLAYIAKHGRPEHFNHIAFGPNNLSCEDYMQMQIAKYKIKLADYGEGDAS